MATELGQAYVQIIPSARGISGKITQAIDPESKSAGKSSGKSIAGGIKKAIVAAGIGVALKKAITEGGNLEQSIGGIETLFKDNANTVRKYADEAFKTVGVSANEYMENVTSFSASLLQSMGGDTKEAAKVAHTAMVDMGDNANKMGTSMRDIQNAYQGFAKQNYTMLDNLKLGYGGTKTEMERLLKDAQKLTGVEYNIDNLDDVFMAVHAIQQELGITGTTALEAEETIQGSFNAMKSAFTNVLGALAIGEGLSGALSGLATTVSTFLFDNLIPMVMNIVSTLPEAVVVLIQEAAPRFIEAGTSMITSLLQGAQEFIPQFLESVNLFIQDIILWIQEKLPSILDEGINMITEFANGIWEGAPSVFENIGEILNNLLIAVMDLIPVLLEKGVELISSLAQGIWNNLPEIVDSMLGVLGNLLDTIIEKYPEYFKKGWEIIGNLAKGIWDNLPNIISTLFNLINSLIQTIGARLPEFLKKGLELIGQMALGLIKAIPSLVAKIPQIIGAILKGFGSLGGSMLNIGADIVKGLWNGISSVTNWIKSKIKGFVGGITDSIKNFFGIRSPSKLMADEVGKFLPEGLAVGIEGNTKPLTDTMDDLGKTTVSSFQPNLALAGASYGGQQFNIGYDFDGLISSIDRLANRDVVVAMNSKEIVRQTAQDMDKELGNLSKLKERW